MPYFFSVTTIDPEKGLLDLLADELAQGEHVLEVDEWSSVTVRVEGNSIRVLIWKSNDNTQNNVRFNPNVLGDQITGLGLGDFEDDAIREVVFGPKEWILTLYSKSGKLCRNLGWAEDKPKLHTEWEK